MAARPDALATTGQGAAGRGRPLPAPRQRPNRRYRGLLDALPFLLPGLLLFGTFVLWPLLQGVRISFYDWSIMPGVDQTFVGLDNYKRILIDPTVRLAIRNTGIYVLVTVPGQILVGTVAALGLNAIARGKAFWRALYYLPVLTSWVVVSFLFKYLFTGGPSPINWLLKDVLHLLPNYLDWLQDGLTAQVPITLLGIWKGVGWTAVIVLAGLQGIGQELYEAAAIDGANRWQAAWHLTVPLLRPVFLFLLVVLTIGGFGVFISVQLLTGGGPMGSTQVLLSYIYDKGFRDFEFGYGFALATLLGLLIWLISFLQFRFVSGKVEQ